jgi:heat shock protein HslJ
MMQARFLPALLALGACTPQTPPTSAGEVARPAPPSPATATGERYIAKGSEPGWMVTIDDRHLTFVSEGRQIGASRPEPRTTFNGHRYETPGLVIDITHVRCTDAMSGIGFKDTVMAIAGEKTYHGCGGEVTEPPSVSGTSWTITALNGTTVPADDSYYLTFGANDRLSGKAGCNILTAPYLMSGATLTVGPIAMTKMACAPELMEHERLAADILALPVQMQFQGSDALILSSSSGRMTLKRAI